jgi:hypothetical protein
MKLRINGNSIRLRLSRSEVANFDATGHIEDLVDFGTIGKFTYGMTIVEDSTVTSSYNSSGLQVKVPRSLAQDWTKTDRIEISAEQPVGAGKTLQILIEKDFQCIHKPSAGDHDAYPNPLAAVSDHASD